MEFLKNSSLKFLLKFSIARRSCTSFSRRLETSLSQILAAKLFTSALESLVLENFAEHSCLWNKCCGFHLSQLLSELGSHQSLRLDMSNCLMDKSSGAINLRSCGALVWSSKYGQSRFPSSCTTAKTFCQAAALTGDSIDSWTRKNNIATVLWQPSWLYIQTHCHQPKINRRFVLQE